MKAPALPPGYRLTKNETGVLGAMFSAYGPGGVNLGGCGGGPPGPKSDRANERRAAEICWNDFGHKCAPVLEALRARALWDSRDDTNPAFVALLERYEADERPGPRSELVEADLRELARAALVPWRDVT